MDHSDKTAWIQEYLQLAKERWQSACSALKQEDRLYADRLAAMVHIHTKYRFSSKGNPFETVIPAVFIEIQKQHMAQDSPAAIPED